MNVPSTVETGVSGSAPRSYSATDTVRSGAATGTLDASRNENIMRFCPQASVPPGSMICGKTLGAWLPCHAVTASLAGSGVVAHASGLPEGAAEGRARRATAGATAGGHDEADGERDEQGTQTSGGHAPNDSRGGRRAPSR